MSSASNGKDFDFETIAVVVACLLEAGQTLGPKYFQMMADIHGTRTQSSFEHQFRKVKQRAKEIQEAMKDGSLKKVAGGGGSTKASVAPVTMAAAKKAAKNCGTKRGRKVAQEIDDASAVQEDDEEGSDQDSKPYKKIKIEKDNGSHEGSPDFEI